MWTKKSQEVERIIMEMRRKTCFQDTGKGRCLGKKTKKGQLYMMCQDCSRMKMKEKVKSPTFKEERGDITDKFKRSGYNLARIQIVPKETEG